MAVYYQYQVDIPREHVTIERQSGGKPALIVERQIVSGMDDELFSEDLELPTTHSEGNDVEHTA